MKNQKDTRLSKSNLDLSTSTSTCLHLPLSVLAGVHFLASSVRRGLLLAELNEPCIPGRTGQVKNVKTLCSHFKLGMLAGKKEDLQKDFLIAAVNRIFRYGRFAERKC